MLAIALSNNSTLAMRARIFYDDPPINPTNAASILQTGKPEIAPYIGYWPMGAQFNGFVCGKTFILTSLLLIITSFDWNSMISLQSFCRKFGIAL